MNIACVQLQIKDTESKAERIDRVSALLEDLQGLDLIVLPELWATGYFSFDHYVDEAEEIAGPFVQRFAELARQLKTTLFAGSFVERQGQQYYNTSVLFNPEGERISTYRKIHLFRYGSKEGEILTRGQDISVGETSFGKVGLSTCYDLRFPELYRHQIDLGAEFLLVTSAWPLARLDHWQLFNAARAVENQCFLISCNGVGQTQGVALAGHSQVVSPWGTILASAQDQEMILHAEIDPRLIEQIRREFPQLKHRVL